MNSSKIKNEIDDFMQFNMNNFLDDELTHGIRLAQYVCDNYKAIPDVPGVNKINRFVINVMSDNYELLDNQFAFIENDMIDNHCRDLWVCWRELDGELQEWWITGDNC